MITLKLAWRNIFRQKIRTGLTVSAIVFCTVSILLTMAVAHGMHQDMIQSSVSIFTGHFQVQGEGYLDDPSLSKSFEIDESTLLQMDEIEGIEGVAPRITSGGLASTDEKTAGTIVVGVDPKREAETTTLLNKVVLGKTIEPGAEKKALIGKTMAENLDLEPGQEIQLMVQSFYGSLELGFFEVAGLVTTGSPDFDRGLVVIPLEDARYLYQMEGMVTEVAAVLSAEKYKEPAMASTRELLKKADKQKLVVVPWEELLPELVELLYLDNAGAVLYLAILVIVVAFIVLLTITMSVMERVKEFGVLMAIGTRPRRLFFMIVIECIIMGLLGTLIGLIIASIPAYYWSVNPIEMSSMAEAYKEFGIEPRIMSKLNVTMFWSTALIMTVITVLSSIVPAVRAVRIRPVEAMRHI